MAKNKIVILGAGITGLTTAYWLRKAGIEVEIVEARSEAGGSMQSERKDGFLIDYGPTSGLDTTPLIGRLVEELGLQPQLIFANQEAKKRYILKNKRLISLPTGPLSFLGTDLFPASAKLRLLKEPFVKKTDPTEDISIADFVRHRLGEEFLTNAVDPFISGIYAGNPEKLSVKSAMPRLYALEEKYGSLIKGAIAGARERKKSGETSKQSAQQFSFKEGMQTLPRALAASMNDSIQYDSVVEKIEQNEKGFRLNIKQNNEVRVLESEFVLSTIPAHRLSKTIQMMDESLAQHLEAIHYPPVMVLYLAFRRSAIRQPLDGFGFLIPGQERRPFLGAIWSSVIFENRAEDEYATFTLFVGGARKPDLLKDDLEAKKKEVIKEFKQLMMIAEPDDPVLMESKVWPRAIPQYNIGHALHEAYFQQFEETHPGFFIGGNFRGGISVSDCIKSSDRLSQQILEFVRNRS
ncbi:oxygen-dependent protoporphyrinogen oxidase [Catalinimonas alkaloidigena]|uniref:protoporphyrinogen oxidase n=1 Tax=Catalinimonas alkaloidigena TaxID=1075417 RepID=UPI00240534C6|nr:protoporphyrinogen oxidase [Catalinimonas alkaloidigena]MDF9798472.1 oxygen-dependent protoporphyrinogen oxidase [Catalinimonas alkaloidigena]